MRPSLPSRRFARLALSGLALAAVSAAGAAPRVLVAAIGDEQPVFDRFVADLARRLQAYDVAGVATASASGRVGRKLDAPADLHDAVRALHGDRAGGCLVYLTGHGTQAGLSLPLGAASVPAPGRAYASIDPPALARALRAGCGDAPTVVVLSACYSGVYLRPPLTAPNRVVLAAAAPDRTSFGCGNDETHTYYDGCFLAALDAAASWRDVARRTTACVAALERRLPGVRPSRPQASFGAAVRDLPLPPRRGRPPAAS